MDTLLFLIQEIYKQIMRQIRYAGIGSRDLPEETLVRCTALAEHIDKHYQFTLRSGNAEGADLAFLRGSTRNEVFLPWPTYNGGHKDAVNVSKEVLEEAIRVVKEVHPYSDKLSKSVEKLHARNLFILLGANLDVPVDLVIYCRKPKVVTGGTEIALRMAKKFKIPTINVFEVGVIERFKALLENKFNL